MKRLLILTIASLFFLSCEKQEVKPEYQLLTVEAWIYTQTEETFNLNIDLIGEGIGLNEKKEVTIIGQSIIFKASFYMKVGSEANLYVTGLNGKKIGVYGYTDFGHNSFKLVEGSVKIKLIENGFKDVMLE
jgi:hypothetical protein